MDDRYNNMFPGIWEEETNLNDAYRRSVLYYPLIKKSLENVQTGKSVVDLLLSIGITHVGLYAVNEFMDYVLMDSKLPELSAFFIYDRDYVKFDSLHLGNKVFSPEKAAEDYKRLKIEKLIICNLIFADEIFDDFVSRGIQKKDILTIDALIYGVDGLQ